jgi:hypothetical protein
MLVSESVSLRWPERIALIAANIIDIRIVVIINSISVNAFSLEAE